jgi:hypothetical protein
MKLKFRMKAMISHPQTLGIPFLISPETGCSSLPQIVPYSMRTSHSLTWSSGVGH